LIVKFWVGEFYQQNRGSNCRCVRNNRRDNRVRE